MNKTYLAGAALVLVAIAGYLSYSYLNKSSALSDTQLDPTPKNVTLTGTYTCLPHKDTSGPQTEECAFGFKTDDGLYYAVNFGASASAMEQFQTGAHVIADGFVVIREALSSDHWAKYNMEGIFTVTKVHAAGAPAQGKLNIDAVCRSALAYMTFSDGAAAEAYVADCKQGKHPEVIERYKADMGLGDGAAI